MRKIFMMIVSLLCIICAHGQTFTSGHITTTKVVDSMFNDSTECVVWLYYHYDITIDSSYIGETIYVVDTVDGSLVASSVNTTGTSPWTYLTPEAGGGSGDYSYGGAPGVTIFYNEATKVDCGADTLYMPPLYDTLIYTNSCMYGTVSGRVYADNNSNCIYDAGDVGINPEIVIAADNISTPLGASTILSPRYYYYPPYSGTYTLYLQQSWMVNYTVTIPPYYAFIFPASPCFTTSYSFTTLPQTGVDFPLVCTGNVDVQCYALSPGHVRLHRPFFVHPYVSNTGCDTVSGQLTLVLDNRTVYDAALSSHPADIVHGDTLIWNYSHLASLTDSAYWNSFFSDVYLTMTSSVVVGDILCFRVYTNIPATDINPANNDYTVCIPVVYSYDPNSKAVSPQGTGPQGYIPAGADTLTYTLNFQNTGSDVAENITVIDTLNSHINAASLKVLGTSHNMFPKWLAPGVVAFEYQNINLPDSSANEPASHGQVRFSVALNGGILYGTQIKNTGYIYFDANPPVVTNTTLNTIRMPNSIHQLATTTNAKIYPNPATDNLTIENLDGGEITILNLEGIEMMKQTITGNKVTINVGQLPGGVYILKTVSSNATGTVRFTKY